MTPYRKSTKPGGDSLWWRQQQAWKAAIQQTKERDHAIRADTKAKYKHKWRNLHHKQRKESRYVERISRNIFERAVYVFSNRRDLGSFDKPLTRPQMIALITSGDRLKKRIAAIHQRDRTGLARQSKLEAKALTEPLWTVHKQNLDTMKARQTAERRSLRREGWAAAKEVGYDAAKQSLAAEQNNAPREFQMPDNDVRPAQQFHRTSGAREMDQSNEAQTSGAEQIKRDMQAWRRRQRGHDQGREL